MPVNEPQRALADRREELAGQADLLRRLARKRWRVPLARFELGAASATVNLASRNVPAAIISALGGILGAKTDRSTPIAYSYLFAAEQSLNRG